MGAALQTLRAVPTQACPPATVSGLTPSAKALVVAGLAHQLARPVVVLTADNETAANFQRTTSTFLGWLDPSSASSVLTLPAVDHSPYEGRSPHAEILEQRAVTLWTVARGRARVLHVPVAAALGRFRERAFYSSLALGIKLGDEIALDDLAEHLSGVGYEREEPVSDVGQFSMRGGIVDVFPPEAMRPFRIEFFGDQVESLREFDPDTQRSKTPVPEALLLPLSEANRSRQFFEKLVRALDNRTRPERGTHTAVSPHVDREPEWASEYSNPFPGWEFFAPLVEPHPNTILALFQNPVLLWDEPIERNSELKCFLKGLAANFDEVRDVVPPRPKPEDIFLTEQELFESVGQVPQLYLKELSLTGVVEGREVESQEVVNLEMEGGEPGSQAHDLEAHPVEPEPEAVATRQNTETPASSSAGQSPGPPGPEFVLLTQPSPKFQAGVKGLVENLQGSLERGTSVVLATPTSGKAERLREILNEYQIPFDTVTEEAASTGQKAVQGSGEPANPEGTSRLAPVALMARGDLAEGLAIPDLAQMWLSDSDIFGGFDWASRRREHSGIASFISDLADLRVGDYVVHLDHGVGIYQGLRKLSVEDASRDFMLLTYQDGAKLYVPLERLDLVEKYRSGGEGVKPALDRLGGTSWERTKTRVKRALRDMAEELLHLYAERKMSGGTPASPDTPWQEEFEDAFEFEETPDQLKALADIKKDLESPEPMDRLLCGDVGYGKTELALRAAFKVIQDGRQVALLAPTTVLAFQHYTTFKQRMAAFPMRVEMLSRFRQPAEQKKIVAEAEAGRVDVLIGTHRLLSKDVRFRDLGLLIVDEEQRFGVAAKEKLRKFKAGVDVLAMSATPIPRSLHMALGGLRDLSVIETPPRGRLAIQTAVAPFSNNLIQSAILQEMQREGQVFFVHNRVETIFQVAALVQRLVPTARIGVAHGQMGEKELEKVMLKFMQNEYEVLVATALIENGLDIPRANTIIINHAERFGLADLYQLRGRVGRSNRRAYAYFLVASEDALTPLARRRLAALKEFSELGDRLSARRPRPRVTRRRKPSGSRAARTFECHRHRPVHEDARASRRGVEGRPAENRGAHHAQPGPGYQDSRPVRRRREPASAPIQTNFQPGYTRGAHGIEAELNDRFGPIPPSVSNLLAYGLLKSAAEQLLVQSIERKAEDVWMRFHEQTPLEPQRITAFVRRRRDSSLRPDGVLRFRLRDAGGNTLQEVQNVLQELQASH